MDQFTAEHIVARALVALGKRHRAERLAIYPRELVAEAMLGAIIDVDHPSSVSTLMCDIVVEYGPDEAAVERAITVVADKEALFGTRAACLRALGEVGELLPRLLAAGLEPEILDRLTAEHASWRDVLAGHEEWLSQFAYPELPGSVVAHASELEVQRALRERSADYRSFIAEVFDPNNPETGALRITAEKPEFVIEALVDFFLRCSPEEREVVRRLATTFGTKSPIANARLAQAVLDGGTVWDLKAQAFILHVELNGAGPRPERTQLWATLDDFTWERLQRAYIFDAAPHIAWHGPKLVQLIEPLDERGFEELMVEIRRCDLRPVDWNALIYDDRVSHLRPSIAEHIAAEGATKHIGALVVLLDDLADSESRARVNRAIMRLRALVR